MMATYKGRSNYGTGLKQCFATCKCPECRKKLKNTKKGSKIDTKGASNE